MYHSISGSYCFCSTKYMLHTKLNFTSGELAARMREIYSLKMTLQGLKHAGMMQNLNTIMTSDI